MQDMNHKLILQKDWPLSTNYGVFLYFDNYRQRYYETRLYFHKNAFGGIFGFASIIIKIVTY